jgi:predicted DNA-binding transcriptional regulator YafY
MYLKPSFDFRQEILSMGEDVEVIAPLSFREEMKNIFNKMKEIYN